MQKDIKPRGYPLHRGIHHILGGQSLTGLETATNTLAKQIKPRLAAALWNSNTATDTRNTPQNNIES